MKLPWYLVMYLETRREKKLFASLFNLMLKDERCVWEWAKKVFPHCYYRVESVASDKLGGPF